MTFQPASHFYLHIYTNSTATTITPPPPASLKKLICIQIGMPFISLSGTHRVESACDLIMQYGLACIARVTHTRQWPTYIKSISHNFLALNTFFFSFELLQRIVKKRVVSSNTLAIITMAINPYFDGVK